MIQKIYYNENECITLDIPEDGAIGLLVSGGTDSSLLCYLLVDTILKNNLKTKIYPITAEMLRRPYCLTYASNVLDFISKKTGFQFERHLCFSVPNHTANLSDDERNGIYSRYTDDYMTRYKMSVVFHGNTANPPIIAVPDTQTSRRPASRDDLEWRKQQEASDSLRVPFVHVDKKVIAQLYKKYDLMTSLFPITRSCEGELVETAYFTKDCFASRPSGQECWWCRERAYGFDEDYANASVVADAHGTAATQLTRNKPDCHVLTEKIYYTDDKYITLKIPIAGAVGCYVSGGTDSALVCYLLAKTIMKYKLKTKVYPITGEILKRPYNMRFASDVLEFVSAATGFTFSHHLTYYIPNHQRELSDQERDTRESSYIDEFTYKYNFITIFCGNISNPPVDQMPPSLFPERPMKRDDEAWKKAQEDNSDLEVPLLRHDKKVVGQLYQKLGLLETLLPRTRSCESSLLESAFFSRDCFKTRVPERTPDPICWSCAERAYGFNGLKHGEDSHDRKDLLLAP